jgi:hypothetical protein
MLQMAQAVTLTFMVIMEVLPYSFNLLRLLVVVQLPDLVELLVLTAVLSQPVLLRKRKLPTIKMVAAATPIFILKMVASTVNTLRYKTRYVTSKICAYTINLAFK